jgi:ribosome-associated protein
MEGESLFINDELVIPLAELQFRFSRSSGPGGQHVQKSSTRVELYFDVLGSPSLNEEQRSRILSRLAGYIDTVGLLHLVAQSERSQLRNRQEVTERFQELLRAALRRRRRRLATHPSGASREQRLRRKKERGEVKRSRGRVGEEE